MTLSEQTNSYSKYSSNLTQPYEGKTFEYNSFENSLDIFKKIQDCKDELLEKAELIDKYNNILATKIQRTKFFSKKKRRMYLNYQQKLMKLKTDMLKNIANLEQENIRTFCLLKSTSHMIDYTLMNIQTSSNKHKITWY